MKTALRWVAGVGLLVALSTTVCLLLLAWVLLGATHDSVNIVIDGQRYGLPEWQELQGLGWAAAGGGLLLAALLLMLMLPLALLLCGLGVLLGLGMSLLIVLLVLGLLLSPLWLCALLLWWLLKPKPAASITP